MGKKLFNSTFNSKLNKKYSFKLEKQSQLEKTMKNMQNGQFFPQNALFIHFSYEYRTFLIHSKIHSIVWQKY